MYPITSFPYTFFVLIGFNVPFGVSSFVLIYFITPPSSVVAFAVTPGLVVFPELSVAVKVIVYSLISVAVNSTVPPFGIVPELGVIVVGFTV